MPHICKKIGYVLFVPSLLLGLYVLVEEFPDDKWPYFSMWSVNADLDFFGDAVWFTVVTRSFFKELVGTLFMLACMLIAFSREKEEDEYMAKLRLDALAWAVIANYAVLVLALWLVHGFSFVYVMIVNMYTTLLIFIIRFHWALLKNSKNLQYAE